ncbi:MAG: GyrI-like domain-containing protein [Flavobacteriaceae bacterium]|nr:GyrI-like domain-containing protein [Flavobacteriaceae bacterium]
MKDSVRIIDVSEKRLVGCKKMASLNDDINKELWQGFMPRLNEIQNKLDSNYLSVQIYDLKLEFRNFTQHTIFANWAAVEVNDVSELPSGMDKLIIPKGKYAVFIHVGTAKEAFFTTQYIFKDWLPASKFQLDNRPHFQIMESDYNPNDPNAKETFWIPIK